jgi:hypothetical protein
MFSKIVNAKTDCKIQQNASSQCETKFGFVVYPKRKYSLIRTLPFNTPQRGSTAFPEQFWFSPLSHWCPFQLGVLPVLQKERWYRTTE